MVVPIERSMHDIFLRPATSEDTAFALHVTEACMRVYAEQTWGAWDRRADLNLAVDEIIQLAGSEIGLIGIERHLDHWLGQSCTSLLRAIRLRFDPHNFSTPAYGMGWGLSSK
jgi:hypothetical protein